ncbi:MAG: hypothetical protein ICV78_18220, partial [Tolypothrix sp. Co-bin9]|nr:hypothetical protein [Tolypothrix sp. Co-bin9]
VDAEPTGETGDNALPEAQPVDAEPTGETDIQKLVKNYQFDNCSFNLAMQISPATADQGRRVVIGIKAENTEDSPSFKVRQVSNDLAELPSIIQEILSLFQSELPSKLASAIERQQNRKNLVDDEDEGDEEESDLPQKRTQAAEPKQPKAKAEKRASKPTKPELPSVEIEIQTPEETGGNKVQLTLF